MTELPQHRRASLVVQVVLLCACFCLQPLGTKGRAETSPACKLYEFSCDNGKCVGPNRYCDGTDDCGDGSDEPVACSNCNRTYYGQQGAKYALRMSEPFQRHLSFVCRMEFVAAGGEMGDLVEISFLSFQVGFYHRASNSSPSCLQGHMQVSEELERNALAVTRQPYVLQALLLTKERPHHRSHHNTIARLASPDRGSSPQVPHVNISPLEFGGFCGSLVGRSAAFYSSRPNVSLTVTFPVTSTINMATAGVFLTYRFLKRAESHRDSVYYGDKVAGSYCDRVLTNCHEQNCRVRSPNYPGFYLRNVTCTYHVHQTYSPPGRVAQIVFHQKNEYKISIHSGLANAGGILALTTECAGDVVQILDGAPGSERDAVVLLQFCGSGQLPEVISSGPDATVRLVSVPFQQLLDSRVEMDVSVRFIDPTELRLVGRSCKFVVDSSERRSGIIYTPRQTLPDNTICTFEFRGRSRFDRVWLYFTSYFVPDRQPWSSVEKCDVSQLEIYDSPVFDTGFVPPPVLQERFQYGRHTGEKNASDHSAIAGFVGRFCEKSIPRICSHANDYPSLVPPRPCHVETESYLSSSPRMALLYRVFGNGDVTSQTSSLVARYEFVDTSQNGAPVNNSQCDRVFRSTTKSRGRVASPRNTFFYGRGGQQDLACTYRFQGTSSQRVRLRFDKVFFASEGCSTAYDPTQLRYTCKYDSRHFVAAFGPSAGKQRHAELRITESWLAISIPAGCICSNSTFLPSPLDVTSVGSELLLSFVIVGMTVDEDFTNFGFEASYEFLPPNDCGGDTGLLRGIVGEASLALTATSDDNGLAGPGMGAYRSGVYKRCRWLLEAAPEKFLYLNVIGGKRQSRNCGDSRLLVYSGEDFTHTTIICADSSSHDEAQESITGVDIFSPSWSNGSSVMSSSSSTRPERLLLETLCTGSSTPFRVRWMEVTRPFFKSNTGQSFRNVDCLYECPELEACISPELWCDGETHCPSGYDEVPENCTRFPTLPVALGCVGAVAIFILAFATLTLMRRSCQFRKSKADGTASATRHVGSEEMPMDSI
ncbi:uncharacterized protein [Dermacentor andersoni]|uniref:uncharacterized protein n=1 Tax=Dermacentor andersoni TaxID=34620 RepID=UPI002155A20D|nr:uncharacterized protein LOC126526671 [Dermacentor andersoni]